jgi:hypothetical protein
MAGNRPAVTVDDRETRRALRRMGDRATDLEPADTAAGEMVLAEARRQAPKKSGELARSLELVPTRPGVMVTTDLVYAGPIHYGWPRRNIEAQPFLDESLTTIGDDIVKPYEAYTDDLVRTFDRETPG